MAEDQVVSDGGPNQPLHLIHDEKADQSPETLPYGYLAGSNGQGRFFSIPIEDEDIFRLLSDLLIPLRLGHITQREECTIARGEQRCPVCVKCSKPLEISCEIEIDGAGVVNQDGVLVVSHTDVAAMKEMCCKNCKEPINVGDLAGWDFAPEDQIDRG